ncbi:hypothetical protein [Kitasatospora sp. NPDC057223]|uniref:hypothetical protein n=1 Tax=Kitasatospora sp. NPDC057223 TaxID=3346055 RepID=UPI003633C374
MDHELVSTQLAQVASRDSRELDRICEAVAAALIDSGTEPRFAVNSADFAGDPFLICADRYWRRRMLEHPTVGEAAACAHWLESHVSQEHQQAVGLKWALGYAFITRDNVESASELRSAAERLRAAEASRTVARFAARYQAGKLQTNFQFDALRQFLETSPLVPADPGDALMAAFGAFAAFGSRNITVEYAVELLDLAWHTPLRTQQVTDICLNALWAARPFDGQGELLRGRAEQAVADHPDAHVFYFRLAAGLRMCERFDDALDGIDTALRLLPAHGSRGSHGLLQEQYLRERHTILDGRARAAWTARQQHLWDQQDAANRELRQTMQSATVRAVELVAVFTAAIAFAIGSLQVALSGTLGLGDRVWLLVTMGGGMLLFALLIVSGTWYLTREGGRQR